DVVKLADLAQPPGRDDPGALSLVGAALHRAGRDTEAVAYLERAARGQKGGTVLTQLFLALALHGLGRAADARRWLDRAVARMGRVRVPGWPWGVIWRQLRAEAEGPLRPAG